MNNLIPESYLVEILEKEFSFGKIKDLTAVRRSQNDVYKVTFSKGTFAVKVFLSNRNDIIDDACILQQHLFAERIRERGVKTEIVRKSKEGQTVCTIRFDEDWRFFCFYDWVDGDPATRNMDDDQLSTLDAEGCCAVVSNGRIRLAWASVPSTPSAALQHAA